jgi:Ca2+-binding RTX toxin-like protein
MVQAIRGADVMKAKLLVLVVSVVIAFIAIAPAGAETFDVTRGTNCNDWTPNKHNHEPDNNLCDGEDIKVGGGVLKDKVYGGLGWDYVGTGDGGDVVYGGSGMEQIYAGPGADNIYGQNGHDHLFLQFGDDLGKAADGRDEPGNVEEVICGDGYDKAVVDEDPADGVTISRSCEVAVVKDIGLDGPTRIFNTHKKNSSHTDEPYTELKPGTYTNLDKR